LPQYYTDYLADKWTNEIILTYPNDDDAMLYLFTLITEKYGWKFIDALKPQNPKWLRGTATPSFYIADNNVTSRAHSISFSSYTGFALGLNSTLHSDVYMAWPQTGTIFSSTRAPETAKLFMNFLMSDGFQKTINPFGFATCRKFDTGQALKQKNMDPLEFGRFMSDRRVVESWRFDFEDAFGTPQGLDPVELISI
jgi:ABC-type Fe3+ transport system substrate-binding protein